MNARRVIPLGVATLLAVGCVDRAAGPAGYRAALAIVPRFAAAAPAVTIDRVRILLSRPAGAALDTVAKFPAAADSLVLDLTVTLQRATETFVLEIALIDVLGDTVFRANPVAVTLTAGRRAAPVTPTFRFTGGVPVVFAGDSSGGLSSGVFTVRFDGSARFRLDRQGGQGEVHPRWSPDYRRVAFTFRPTFGVPNELHLVAVSGDTTVPLVTDSSARRPRWSPDGVRLAFECGDGFSPGQDVCVIPDVTGPIASLQGRGNGAGKLFVTDFDRAKTDGPGTFAWDPLNPQRLAVVRDSVVGAVHVASRLYLVPFDGSAGQPLSPPVMDLGTGPLRITGPMDWSPDGATLVFAGSDTLFMQHLYAIRRDGTGLRRLTGTAGDFDRHPVFSPDGSEILFLRDRSCSTDYWVIGADGTGERQVSAEGLCDFDATPLGHDWSPGGTDLVLVGTVGGNFLIYRVPAATTSLTYSKDRFLIGRGVDLTGFVTDLQPSWRP